MLHLDLLVKQRVDDEVCHDLGHHHHEHDWKEGREVVGDLDDDDRERNSEPRDASHERRSTHDGIDPRIDVASVYVVEHEPDHASISRAYHHLR